MKSSYSFALAVVVSSSLLLSADSVLAQDGRLTGRVEDPEGQPIAEVTITVTNVDNGQVAVIESDDDGSFFRRALTVGRYDILFEKDGYVAVMEQRRIGSGQTRVDAVMEPAVAVPVGAGASPEYAAAYEAFEAGDQARVIEILTPLVESEPELAQGQLLLARAHFELGQWEPAIEHYRLLTALEPEVAIAHLDLGVSYIEIGDLESASESFERALALQPDDADAHYNVGTMYVRADRVEEAVQHLTTATELDPEHALAHKALAFALVRTLDVEGAIRHLERYLEILPEAADAAEMAALLEQLRAS